MAVSMVLASVDFYLNLAPRQTSVEYLFKYDKFIT